MECARLGDWLPPGYYRRWAKDVERYLHDDWPGLAPPEKWSGQIRRWICRKHLYRPCPRADLDRIRKALSRLWVSDEEFQKDFSLRRKTTVVVRPGWTREQLPGWCRSDWFWSETGVRFEFNRMVTRAAARERTHWRKVDRARVEEWVELRRLRTSRRQQLRETVQWQKLLRNVRLALRKGDLAVLRSLAAEFAAPPSSAS
jgi:hypothetical protein